MKIGFRRAHDRKATWFTNEVVDKKTGELVQLPSMTKQSFVEQCDINRILSQYKVSGMLSHVSAHAAQGSYEDLPDNMEFQDALHIVMDGQKAFSTLPSSLRNRFGNDPAEFLAFMADPANAEEIVKLGLAIEAPPPDATLRDVVDAVKASQPPEKPSGTAS